MVTRTVTLAEVKQGLAAIDTFSQEKRPVDFGFLLAEVAAAFRKRVKTQEEYRLANILPYHVKRDPKDKDKPIKDQRILTLQDKGKDTGIPDFVEGGRVAYQRELDELDRKKIEVTFPVIPKKRFAELRDEDDQPVSIEPWILEALTPFFDSADEKADAPTPAEPRSPRRHGGGKKPALVK